jgi:pilus assembly protein CpaB
VTPAARRLIALAVAAVLAIAGVLAVLDYARRADERAIADQQPVGVLVVTQQIPRGTPSEALADSVRRSVIPAAAVAEGAILDLAGLAEVAGLVAAVDLLPGEQLLARRFVTLEELDPSKVTTVPSGLQEISFLLPMERVVGGRISSGSSVAVYASFDELVDTSDPDAAPTLTSTTVTALLVDRLLVTHVQYTAVQVAGSDPDVAMVPAGDLLITFAVDTVTASRLTYAFDQGRVRLTLLDERTDQSQRTPITRENVLG